MKKLLLLAVVLISYTIQAQVVFQSNFENWTAGNPDGWMGDKTNIASANVIQVAFGAVYGSNLCQLVESSTSHKRFTTQNLSVVNGQAYEMKVWVRGEGEIRANLHNGTAYQTYTNYTTVNSATNIQLTYTIISSNTANDAQFILSVVNTVAPNHIMLDSVHIEEIIVLPPPIYSIYDIQYTTNPNGDSPQLGNNVTTIGVVTGIRSNGFYIQDGTGAWNGIMIFTTSFTVTMGDEVMLTGQVAEFNGCTQIQNLTSFSILNSGVVLPAATVISTADVNTEPYEGVLIRVQNAMCTNANAGFGMFEVNDGSGAALVDDDMYNYASQAINDEFNITGIGHFSFSEFKILPRNAADVELIGGGSPTLSIYDIQFTTDPGGASPLNGQTVNTGGIVTGTYTDGYFIQNNSGAWQGIHVFQPGHSVTRGDSITLTANVVEHFNMTQLSGVTNLIVVSQGNTLPAPAIISTAAVNTEPYEGVLVRVNNAICTQPNPATDFGMWSVNDGSGVAKIHNLIFAYTPTLNTLYNITGPVYFSFAEFRIEPRDANDIEISTSVFAQDNISLSLFPNPAVEFIQVELQNASFFEYDVYDVQGRKVLNGRLTNRMQINVSELNQGSYLLMLKNSAGNTVQKIFTVLR
ncbi:MAG: T9SS type A sorting domain-containing protein [Flavobacteriales bacterium]